MEGTASTELLDFLKGGNGMRNRLIEGYKLYKRGNVDLLFEDEELIQFEVLSSKEYYTIDLDLPAGVARCLCPDYMYRHQGADTGLDGSFICKHLWASFFKLAEHRGVGSQNTLDNVLKSHIKKK